jgi:hypothetical protein
MTSAIQTAMRTAVDSCPLCMCRMTDDCRTPTSKELDHIVPLNVGGTHTVANVRIICRLCNLRRPKDGSDYAGSVTFDMVDLKFAESFARAKSDRPRRRRALVAEHPRHATLDEYRAMMTDGEIAGYMGVPRETVAQWRHEGSGPSYIQFTPGRNGLVRYPREDLRAFLAERTRAALAASEVNS